MKVKSIIPRDRAHWHELRAQDVTASIVAGLIPNFPGELPEWFPSHYAIWHHYNGTAPFPIEEEEASLADIGQLMEPVIMELCRQKMGWNIQKVHRYLRIPELKAGASLDSEVINHEDGPGVLELKNVRYLTFRDKWTDEEPPFHHLIQLQCQLWMTGRTWGAIAALIGGEDFRVWPYQRNEKIIQAIEQVIHTFWESIELQNEPPIDEHESTTKALRVIYAEDNGKSIDLTENTEFRRRLGILKQARLDKKAADAAQEAQLNFLLKEIGSAQDIVLDDQIVATCKAGKTSRPLRILEKPKPFTAEIKEAS